MGVYQSAQWPQCGELWLCNEEGEWARKLADLHFAIAQNRTTETGEEQ
jgi:hypothetical protein